MLTLHCFVRTELGSWEGEREAAMDFCFTYVERAYKIVSYSTRSTENFPQFSMHFCLARRYHEFCKLVDTSRVVYFIGGYVNDDFLLVSYTKML